MAAIVSRYVSNGDARIHLLDSGGDDSSGDDSDAPIVFVPGMTDVAADYTEVLPLFGRRTAVVELRGHGLSSAPAQGYDLAARSSDVAAAVDAMTDGPVHLVTFSRGTSYAVHWAIEHSDRVLSISIGDYVPEEKVLTDEQGRQLVDGLWRGTPVRDRLDERAAWLTFHEARDRSMWEPLAQMAIPLLAVRSGASVIVDDDAWARYRRYFPDAQLVEFEDSPHDVFRPDRGRYPLLVRDHVDRSDSR